MECQQCRECSDEFLAGTLCTADREAFGEHVRECGECRRELAAERALDAALSSETYEGLSADFTDRVLACYRDEKARAAVPRMPVLVNIGYAASAAALLYGLTQLVNGDGFLRGAMTTLQRATDGLAGSSSSGIEWLNGFLGSADPQIGVLPVTVSAIALAYALYACLDSSSLRYGRS